MSFSIGVNFALELSSLFVLAKYNNWTTFSLPLIHLML